MTSRASRFLAALPGVVGALGAVACGDRSADFDETISLLPPSSIAGHVVLVDRGRDQATWIDVTGDGPPEGVSEAPLVAGALLTEPRKGSDAPGELLVLCAGRQGTRDDEAPALVVLNRQGVSRTYTHGTRFDSLLQSEDGRYAFLYFGPAAGDGGFLFNPNEVAVIDLAASPRRGNPHLRTLRSFGGAPQGIAFSPPMDGLGGRRLAVVLFESDVGLFDLDHLDRAGFTVELGRGQGSGIGLAQVLFDPVESKVYLRGEGSGDVYVLSLTPRSSPAEGENDFVPSVNQLGVGVPITDMALYREGTATRLLVTNAVGPTAMVVDANTSRVTNVPLPFAARAIHLFEDTSPRDAAVEPRALLYNPGNDGVVFLDLVEVEERLGRNAEGLRIANRYATAMPLSAKELLLLHETTGLSVVDLAERTAGPIESTANLANALPDTAVGKLWLAPAESERIGFLDLENHHPGEVWLDAPVEWAVRVPGSRPRLVVTHASTSGHLTVLDARDPTNLEEAYSMSGFLLDDLLGGAR